MSEGESPSEKAARIIAYWRRVREELEAKYGDLLPKKEGEK